MEKIKVLLTGIGGYGSWYLNELLDTDDDSFELVGIADPYASASQRYEELKTRAIPVYKTPLEFYEDNKADLAVISSPIHTHGPYIHCCLDNKSNVLCEKPVTGSLKEHEELIIAEKKSGLFVGVGFQQCYSRDILELKKDILDGIFGKPLDFKVLRLNARGTNYYHRNGWAGKLYFEGKAIMDSPLQNANAHELQNMLFLLGTEMNSCVKIESAKAELWKGHPDIENYNAVAASFKTDRDVDIFFYTAHCVSDNMNAPLGEYRFENAVIKWVDWGFTAFFNDGKTKVYGEKGRPRPFQKFYDALEAVKTGIPPVCTLETSLSHTHIVSLVQEFPIVQLPREKLTESKTEDGDSFFQIPGISAALSKAYEERKLPSEIGFKAE